MLPNPPALPLRSGGFLVCARSLSESGRVAAALMPRVRHRSEAVEIDHGQLVYPSLSRFAIVMELHELAPGFGGTRSAGCRRRRLGTRAETPPQPGPCPRLGDCPPSCDARDRLPVRPGPRATGCSRAACSGRRACRRGAARRRSSDRRPGPRGPSWRPPGGAHRSAGGRGGRS